MALPRPLTKQEYDQRGVFSAAGIRKRFGSFVMALQLAGINPSRRMRIPTEELLEDLRRVASEVGAKTVSRNVYDERGQFSSAPLYRQFGGSWCRALGAAGRVLSPNANFRGADDDFFKVIEAAWRKLGRPPKQSELRRPEYFVGGYTMQGTSVPFGGRWRSSSNKCNRPQKAFQSRKPNVQIRIRIQGLMRYAEGGGVSAGAFGFSCYGATDSAADFAVHHLRPRRGWNYTSTTRSHGPLAGRRSWTIFNRSAIAATEEKALCRLTTSDGIQLN